MDDTARCYAVHERHLNVKKRDVRIIATAELDGLETVFRLPDHLEIIPFADELADALAI